MMPYCYRSALVLSNNITIFAMYFMNYENECNVVKLTKFPVTYYLHRTYFLVVHRSIWTWTLYFDFVCVYVCVIWYLNVVGLLKSG